MQRQNDDEQDLGGLCFGGAEDGVEVAEEEEGGEGEAEGHEDEVEDYRDMLVSAYLGCS